MNKFAKPTFNSAEENYMEYREWIVDALAHRHMTNGALPNKAWRKMIREQIRDLRKLRAKCDPQWLENFHYCIRG